MDRVTQLATGIMPGLKEVENMSFIKGYKNIKGKTLNKKRD